MQPSIKVEIKHFSAWLGRNVAYKISKTSKFLHPVHFETKPRKWSFFKFWNFRNLKFFFAIFSRKLILIDVFETIVIVLWYVRMAGTSGFGEKNLKNFEKSEKIQKKLEISSNYTVICKNAKKINFFTTTRRSKMDRKLVWNMKLGIGSQKNGVGRNFWFWQKFLPFSLSTEHFPEKCRKMLKNAFFQNCQKSIVFAYFHSKLVLKGVFCSKLWISIT